jgi:NADH-quinone oxidoreductase subunit M
MGFVLLGVSVWNEIALQGAVMQIICHGLATGALFIIVGVLQERIHTRDMSFMGGFWESAPRMAGVALFFALASLGLPGLGNFVGEFLVLLGAFKTSVAVASIAATGIIAATIYALWIIQRAFHGPNAQNWRISDLSIRETVVLAAMITSLVWLGMFPQPVFDTSRQALKNMTVMGVQTTESVRLDAGTGRTNSDGGVTQ